MAQNRVLPGMAFAKALADAGIIPSIDLVYRVAIVCEVGRPIRIDVEGYAADEKLAPLVSEIDEAEVTVH